MGADSVVNGVINGANTTFQTGDIVNGNTMGAASNVNVTIAAASADVLGPLVDLNNIGTATFRTLAAAPINAQLYTNVGTIASSGSNNILTVNNGALASTYALSNSVGSAIDGLAVGIRAGDVTGSSDTVNFSLNAVGTAAVGTTAAVRSALSTTNAGIENIAIATEGTNNFTFTGNTGTATSSRLLTITGSGNNNVQIGAAGMATTSTITAVDATGTLTLDVGGNLTSNDTVIGTAGTSDLVRATVSGVTATGLSVSGFETLRLDSGAAATLSFAANPGLSTVRVDAVAAAGLAGGARQLLSAGGFTTLNYVGNDTAASTTAANNFSGVTATGGYTGAADTLTVNVGNNGRALVAGGAYTVAQAITTTGVETYVINVNDTTANANVTTFNNVSDATMSSLTVNANGSVVLGNVGNVAGTAGVTGNLTAINLAGVTGTNAVSTLTVANNSLAAAATVTAGAGGLNLTLNAEQGTDVVTFVGANGNDTVTANVAGALTLYVGNIVANGGAGNDTFLIGAAGAGAVSAALTGGAGVDIFTLDNGAATNTITDLGTGAFATALGTGRETLTTTATTTVTATVSANFVDTSTVATDTGIFETDGGAVNNVFNLAAGVTTFNVVGATAVGGGAFNAADGVTVNANVAGGATITGTIGADVLAGAAGADTLIGGAGADRITSGGGADRITAGLAADAVTLGADVQTVAQALGDSAAATANTIVVGSTVVAGETMTFGGGIDTVTGFTAGVGGDVLDLAAGGPAQALVGTAILENALVAGTNYYLSGNFVAATGVFTVTANGAGADTMIIQGGAALDASVITTDSAIMLIGVNSANLVAGNII